jgi:hypothetical protein
MRGRIVRTSHESLCLRDNALGDPHERDLYVYLPPQYDGKQRFRVVMMLAGFGSTNHSIAGWSPWKPNTVEVFDRLIAEEQCEPAILVLPDCFNRWGGSQFIDSEGTGRYQTYLADEVIPFVDAEFQTVPEREARAVVGRSSGGFGALRLGMDRPDVVSVIGSHAGDAAFEVSMRPMLTTTAIAIDLAGGLRTFAEEIPVSGPKNASQFDAIFVLAAGAAYSPDTTGFPFAQRLCKRCRLFTSTQATGMSTGYTSQRGCSRKRSASVGCPLTTRNTRADTEAPRGVTKSRYRKSLKHFEDPNDDQKEEHKGRARRYRHDAR